MARGYSKANYEHIRVKVQTLAKEKYSARQIVEKLKIPKSTVMLWINRNSVKDKKRSGRSTNMSPTPKRMKKSRFHRKVESSVRNCKKELNVSRRFKAKYKKFYFTKVQKYSKTTEQHLN